MSAVPQFPQSGPVPGLYQPTEILPPPSIWRQAAARALEVAFTLVVLAVGLYLLPLRVMGTDLANLPGDLDVRFNVYVLEHGWQWLNGHTAGFWDLPIAYPQPRMTAYSDNHLGTLPLYAVFRALGLDRETSFQGWFLALFALNYLSCYLALRGLGCTPVGSAAGAYGFAFGLLFAGQLDHAQLFPLFPAPLAFLLACRVCSRGGGWSWAGLGLLVAWQFYCSIYVGYFLCLLLGAFFPLYFVFCRPAEVRPALPALGWVLLAGLLLVLIRAALAAWPHRTPWVRALLVAAFVFHPAGPRALVRTCRHFLSSVSLRQWLGGGLGVVLFLGCLLVLFRPYLLVIRDRGEAGPPLAAIHALQPTWDSWLSPAPSSWLWGQWTPTTPLRPGFLEHYLFLGLLPTAALVGSALCLPLFLLRRSPFGITDPPWRLLAAAVLAVGILFALTLRVGGFTLYDLVLLLPGTSAVRAVTRIAFLVALPAALCVAAWLTAFEGWARARLGSGAALLLALPLLGAAVADQATTPLYYRRFAKAPFQQQIHAVVEEARRQDPHARLLLRTVPGPDHPALMNYWEFCKLSIEGMLAAQELGVPTLNCYSSYYPTGYLPQFLRASDVEQWRTQARANLGEARARQTPWLSEGPSPGLVVIGSLRGSPEDPCTHSHAPLPVAALQGRLTLAFAPIHWVAGQTPGLTVEVANTSPLPWPALGEHGDKLRMGFLLQWLTPEGQPVKDCPGIQEWLDHDLSPGQAERDPVRLPVPSTPGRYHLRPELLQCHGAAFGNHGSGVSQYPVVVEAAGP